MNKLKCVSGFYKFIKLILSQVYLQVLEKNICKHSSCF
jgi:hypothetical protein